MATFRHCKRITAIYGDAKFPKHPPVLHVQIDRNVKGWERKRLYRNLTAASAERIYRVILHGRTFPTANFPASKTKLRASIYRFESWKSFRDI